MNNSNEWVMRHDLYFKRSERVRLSVKNTPERISMSSLRLMTLSNDNKICSVNIGKNFTLIPEDETIGFLV